MAAKGYKPALRGSEELQSLASDMDAHMAFIPELLSRIESVASGRGVTRAELIRDFAFTPSALRLLRKTKQLLPTQDQGSRATYDLCKALKIRLLQPGLLAATRVRTVRKRANITTVHREFWDRLTERTTIPGAA